MIKFASYPKLQCKEYSGRCDACSLPPSFVKCKVDESACFLNIVEDWTCTLTCSFFISSGGQSELLKDMPTSMLGEGSRVKLVGVEGGMYRKTPVFPSCLLSLLPAGFPSRILAQASDVEIMTLWFLKHWILLSPPCLFCVFSPQPRSGQGGICPSAEFSVRMFPLAYSTPVHVLLAHCE